MEELRKETFASNTPIIVPSKVVDLKHEHKMVVGWDFNHTFLQDKFLSCNLVKHIASDSFIFMMLSHLMLSAWMVVALVRCERVQMNNNMLLVIMVIIQLIMMRQVHRTKFKDKGQVGGPILHLMTG
jgi:hypothetical protein